MACGFIVGFVDAGTVVPLGAVRCVHLAEGGLLLILPSRAIFEDGLAVLHAPFDEARGWNRTGSPLELGGQGHCFHLDYSGDRNAPAALNPSLLRTDAEWGLSRSLAWLARTAQS